MELTKFFDSLCTTSIKTQTKFFKNHKNLTLLRERVKLDFTSDKMHANNHTNSNRLERLKHLIVVDYF